MTPAAPASSSSDSPSGGTGAGVAALVISCLVAVLALRNARAVSQNSTSIGMMEAASFRQNNKLHLVKGQDDVIYSVPHEGDEGQDVVFCPRGSDNWSQAHSVENEAYEGPSEADNAGRGSGAYECGGGSC